ncbi:DUF3368 domain-containing protein [Moorella sp. Hama-1]|uniref:DUF3368 domain-containing protein n=1 Tax=Moorella sp. Hama-1 TaxID=2138101 RepID=UPI0013793F56|nr:DUF3368 domain-containing protein [Moorella sp. Hama-1]BCV22998.1 hypothetical protein hamaS1_30670 [Moorella sp. Hama-1]
MEPTNRDLIKLLRRDLNDGEAEAIALAIEKKAEIVFLDEREAREIAQFYGLSKAGVLGLLIRAKKEGKIPSLRIEFDQLRCKCGFRLAEAIYLKALQLAGEE